MSIDPQAPIPLYFQLKTLLMEEILSGRYDSDGRLPTEHELVERHGISRTPVSRALSELAEEGVILRRRRRGTYVNPHWLRRQPDRPELRVMVPDGPWERQVRQAAPADVRINVATVALPDLHQAVTHAVAEGRAPDLAVLDSVWVPEFASAGFLWPLDDVDRDWPGRIQEADFLEPFVSANRVAGQSFAVQAEADVAGLWYRLADVPLSGGAPPDTWEELLRVGAALAEGGWAGRAIVMPGGSRAGETTTYCLLALLASNGVSVLNADAVTLDAPGTVEALRLVRRLVEDGIMSADVVGYEWDRPVRLLAEGQAAMTFGGSYDARTLAAGASVGMDEVWDHFGFFAVPGGPSGARTTLAGGMVYGIFRQAADAKLAMRVLTHLVAPDALAAMSRDTGQIPPRRSAVRLASRDFPFLSVTAALLDHAIVRPATPAYARVSAQLQTMLEAVLTGRLGPAAATERTAELIAAITGLPVMHR